MRVYLNESPFLLKVCDVHLKATRLIFCFQTKATFLFSDDLSIRHMIISYFLTTSTARNTHLLAPCLMDASPSFSSSPLSSHSLRSHHPLSFFLSSFLLLVSSSGVLEWIAKSEKKESELRKTDERGMLRGRV